MEAERAEQLETALERMRDAFTDVSEEQLERDVAEVIERVRGQQLEKTTSPKTA